MLNNNSAKLNEGEEIDQTCKIIIKIIIYILFLSILGVKSKTETDCNSLVKKVNFWSNLVVFV